MKKELKVPKSQIKFSDYDLVKAALPAGFYVEDGPRGEYYIYRRSMLIATAEVKNDEVKFKQGPYTPEVEFQTLQEKLLKRYPAIDPDRVCWKVFYRLNGSWHMRDGNEYNSADAALAMFSNREIMEITTILCSYHPKDWGEHSLTTISSRLVFDKDTWGRDNGPKTIVFSNLENDEVLE